MVAFSTIHGTMSWIIVLPGQKLWLCEIDDVICGVPIAVGICNLVKPSMLGFCHWHLVLVLEDYLSSHCRVLTSAHS